MDTRNDSAPSRSSTADSALSRRDVLRQAALIGGALSAASLAPAAQAAREGAASSGFAHGVASGDPTRDGIVLWTRLSAAEQLGLSDAPVQWRIWLPEAPDVSVASGTATSSSARDYTVKVDVSGLQAARSYFYQFSALGLMSAVGRFRTAPANHALDTLRFAVASCSCYYAGYFNGYARIAERNDLDLVLHCGDYLYDYADERQEERMPSDPVDSTPPVSLADFRRRYALFRSDPDLQRLHQQHATATVWDNHDLTRRTASVDDPVVQAAVRAFDEWMPNRPRNPDKPEQIYRSLRYGALLDLTLIETCTGRNTAGSSDYADPARTLLGEKQLGYLLDAYSKSAERGTLWRMTVTPVMIGQLNLYTSIALPLDDIVINDGQWDGFVAERNRIYGQLRALGLGNNLFVAGDAHFSTASELTEDQGDFSAYDPQTARGSIGVEFLPSSISRVNLTETLPTGALLDSLVNDIACPLLEKLNPALKFCELKQHGYGIVEVSVEQAVFEFWWQPTVTRPSDREWLGAQFVCASGSQQLLRVADPQPSRGLRQDPRAPQP